MNKVFVKAVFILTGLVIMTSPVLNTVSAGNVIKRTEFEDFMKFSKNGVDDISWGKFKNITEDFKGSIDGLNAKELKYLSELSDHAGKLDNAILQNIDIPAGTKVGDLDSNKWDNIIENTKTFDEKIDIDGYRKAYGDEIFDDADELSDAIGYGKIAEGCSIAESRGGINLIQKVSANTKCLKPWQKTENDVEKILGEDFDKQPSFIKGAPKSYGTKGSSRPDFYDPETKISVEVKNYNLESSTGLYRLKRNIKKQFDKRLNDLPSGSTQTYYIDLRGQDLNSLKQFRESGLDGLRKDILDSTPIEKLEHITFLTD